MKNPLTSAIRYTAPGVAVLPLLALSAPIVFAGPSGSDDLADLTELSLSDLLNIEVTVASRSEQKLSEIPGAVYVLSGDEIRRSGHNSVQEALRMVPGMYVSNWTTSKWDVTSRGFGTGLSVVSLAYLNQLMVLIDGVPVNSNVYAGTDWALQDISMEDIDRIEIIRGPGGILWGANAVHGVVHIITKNSASTQGLETMVRTQNDEKHWTWRNGGTFGETGTYRVSLKHSQYDSNHNTFLGIDESWRINSLAARFDWTGREDYNNHSWARIYSADINTDGFDLDTFDYIPVEDNANGFQLYSSSASPDGDVTYTGWMSYDRQDLVTEFDTRVLQADLEYRRVFHFSDTSNLSAGVGYRLLKSTLTGVDPSFAGFAPNRQTLNTYRAFAIQTWTFLDDDLHFILGGQVEHNDTTGFEAQPTARLSWHPEEQFSTWLAFTNSVRTPSLEERTMTPQSAIGGNLDLEAEKVTSYEFGVRKQLNENVAMDVAFFHNEYNDLQGEEFDADLGTFALDNKTEGESTGVEVAMDFQPSEDWSLRGSYSWIESEAKSEVDDFDWGVDQYHPGQQFNLRSYYDINEHWQLDLGYYHSGDFGDGQTDRSRLDVHFSYQAEEGLEYFFGGQGIVDPYESEFSTTDEAAPRRDLYIGMTWAP